MYTCTASLVYDLMLKTPLEIKGLNVYALATGAGSPRYILVPRAGSPIHILVIRPGSPQYTSVIGLAALIT